MEKREHMHEHINNNLDLRSNWAGKSQFRRPMRPMPYTLKDKDGNGIKYDMRAEAAASFFQDKIWKKQETYESSIVERFIKELVEYYG